MGDAVAVLLRFDRNETDREAVEHAVTYQGHGVAAACRVADPRGDVQSVVRAFRFGDAADGLAVLEAQFRLVKSLERAITVEGLRTVPCVDDVAERHGDAFHGRGAGVIGRAERQALPCDFAFLDVHWSSPFVSSGSPSLRLTSSTVRNRPRWLSCRPVWSLISRAASCPSRISRYGRAAGAG